MRTKKRRLQNLSRTKSTLLVASGEHKGQKKSTIKKKSGRLVRKILRTPYKTDSFINQPRENRQALLRTGKRVGGTF